MALYPSRLIVIICFSTALMLLYSFMLMAFVWGWQKKRKSWPVLNPQDFISVIIPFRNEKANLPNLLNHLEKQTYPHHKFEVILVDDHSTDEGSEVITEFKPKSAWNLKLITSEGMGKKAAIASAMKVAQGEIILQTDADCLPGPAWVENLAAGFDTNVGVVLGVVNMLPGAGFWSTFAALEFMSLQASGAALINLGYPVMGSAANLAYRKSLWQQAKTEGEGSHSGDDVFLIQAAPKYGAGVGFSAQKEGIVETNAAEGFKELIMQRTRWGAKTPEYTSILAQAIALLVAGYALCTVALLIAGIFFQLLLQLFVAMVVLKAFWDYFFLKSYSKTTGQKGLMKWFPAVALVYPFYILITLLAILFLPKKWKGRPIR